MSSRQIITGVVLVILAGPPANMKLGSLPSGSIVVKLRPDWASQILTILVSVEMTFPDVWNLMSCKARAGK